MGNSRSFLKETGFILQESFVKPLSPSEILELDQLIKLQLYGIEPTKNELYSFGEKEIPLSNGTVLRLFSNKPRAKFLKGTHTYHAWIVNAETGEKLSSVQVNKKPKSHETIPSWCSKTDARRILESLRQLNRQMVRRATKSTRSTR